LVSKDGCSNECKIEAGYVCEDIPSKCTPICGDGMIVGTEKCDDSNKNSTDGCSDVC